LIEERKRERERIKEAEVKKKTKVVFHVLNPRGSIFKTKN